MFQEIQTFYFKLKILHVYYYYYEQYMFFTILITWSHVNVFFNITSKKMILHNNLMCNFYIVYYNISINIFL